MLLVFWLGAIFKVVALFTIIIANNPKNILPNTLGVMSLLLLTLDGLSSISSSCVGVIFPIFSSVTFC